jgi:hypothetical protein
MSASRAGLLVSALISAFAPLLAACHGGSPQPFADGSEVPPPPERVRDCPSAVYGKEFNPRALDGAVVAGPLTLAVEARWAGRPPPAFTPDRVRWCQ